MYTDAKDVFARALTEIRDAGLWKHERIIASPQAAHITAGGREVVNFCANNYLGLSSHPRVTAAARQALDERGYGLSSVRFICGTQDRHKDLEAAISTFLGTEDTILYGSCFDANGGLFETLLGEEDAIISDALNHASIIDGVRLCKAERHRYEHDDLADLELFIAASELHAAMLPDCGLTVIPPRGGVGHAESWGSGVPKIRVGKPWGADSPMISSSPPGQHRREIRNRWTSPLAGRVGSRRRWSNRRRGVALSPSRSSTPVT